MAIKKFRVNVTTVVDVEIDTSKFSEEFMKVFRESFYDFNSVEEHAEHLAQLQARSLIGSDKFVEGYGDIRQYGIKVLTDYVDTDID